VNRSRWLVPVAITLAALALRVHHLGRHAVWLDEAFSFHDATGPHWLRDLRLKDVPPLYPLLLGAWIRVAGDGEDDDALILTNYRAYTVLYELHRLG
jgi:hypothetical protein